MLQQKKWPFRPLGRKALLGAGILLVLGTLLPFWGPILVAGVFALGLQPLLRELTSRYGKARRSLSTSLFFLALALVVTVPSALVGMRLYRLLTLPGNKLSQLFSQETLATLGSAYQRVEFLISGYGANIKIFGNGAHMREMIREGSSHMATEALKAASTMVTSLPEYFLALLVFGLFFYLFIRHSQKIYSELRKREIVSTKYLDRFVEVLERSCYDTIVSNFLIGLIQASVVTLGARFAGYSESALIFSFVFALSYIPFIGAGPPGYLLAAVSFLNGNTNSGIILLIVATIAGAIDNVIRPYLLSSGNNKVNPILTFAVVIGAIILLGVKGIFLGPVALTTTMGMLRDSSKPEEKKKAA